MKRRGLYALVAGLTVLAIVALIQVFVIAPGDTESLKRLVAVTREVAPTPDSPAEGIAVHGHWTIEVRNPDGALVELREFENELVFEGKTTLVQLLGRQSSVGGWRVVLIPSALGASGTGAFLDNSGRPESGFIGESGDTETFANMFKTLTVTAFTPTSSLNKLVLSGTATATRNGDIAEVQTYITRLPSTEPPSGTFRITLQSIFTSSRLPSPVSLTTGQTVTATVEISFS